MMTVHWSLIFKVTFAIYVSRQVALFAPEIGMGVPPFDAINKAFAYIAGTSQNDMPE
jgi:adenosyl cobinamide kinase/adenosyl cobinamide phosphate guanylyltransferase